MSRKTKSETTCQFLKFGLQVKFLPAWSYHAPLHISAAAYGAIFGGLRKFETSSNFLESLILAQDERWRRALSMQIKGVSQETTGGRVSNA